MAITNSSATRMFQALLVATCLLFFSSGAGASLEEPDTGPGGPILVVNSSSSEFGRFYAEVLRNEGLNEFTVVDLSSVTAATLSGYDVVILAEMPLSAGQADLFTNWVTGGGNLIAMRPDTDLAPLLGLVPSGSPVQNGYLLVNSSESSPVRGTVAETIQFFGTANRYSINGATELARLFLDATTATSSPAVSIREVGTSGGHAVAFAYDLATSLVYARQGNPAWRGQERDGLPPIRSDDLYFGDSASDPQPDWINLDKVGIPQADEQQRMLAKLILHINADRKPLPRFWYFPDGEKAVVIMTGDDHGNNGTQGRFEQFIEMSPEGCSVADWECIRGTSYMYPDTPLSDADAANYTSLGFEVGLHLTTNCGDFDAATLENLYTQQLGQFAARYPSIPAPATMRHHCIAWGGWATPAHVQLNHDIRLDTTYYYWPPGWVLNRPGFFTGSAMPMRFAELDGTLIDVYQAATHMTDESGQQYPFTVATLLDWALGPEGYYGAFTANMHTDLGQIPESDAIVSSALVRNVPVVSSKQMLDWLDGRNSSSFQSIGWDGSALSFDVAKSTGARGLEAYVPYRTPAGSVTAVTGNGSPVIHSTRLVKGVEYAFFPVETGNYVVSYQPDTTSPSVLSTSPAEGETDVSRLASVSAVFDESLDQASVSAATVQLRGPDGTPLSAGVSYDVLTHTVELLPDGSLAENTTYSVTLEGGASGIRDFVGNPLAADYVWAFTTGTGPNCPCGAWMQADSPVNPSEDDAAAVEVGVKFTVDLDGLVSGIRFYKGAGNTGQHVGSLWTLGGELLASAAFTGETASGWQEMAFDAPVSVSRGTVYVASYHAPNGRYASDEGYFLGSGVDAGPVNLLQDGVSGGNGVFEYGGAGTFPTESFQGTNYWVDIVFSHVAVADTTPPSVVSISPAANATGISVATTVAVTFDEAMNADSLSPSTFELRDIAGTLVPSSVVYDTTMRTATLAPNAPLLPDATYTAIAKGGTGAIEDLAGNPLASDASWSFTTEAPDTTAPSITEVRPTDGSTGVSRLPTVTATFDEALNPATVNETTFQLRDLNGVTVPAAVSYDADSSIAALVPQSTLEAAATLVATIRGGSAGIQDLAGNPLASDRSWSFTTGSSESFSAWDASASPTEPSEDDSSAVEVGVKFTVDAAGYISGVRFYKGSGNTGTHVGNLWTAGGQQLASTTFTNESATGWQQADFSAPVAVESGTVYVASYHAPNGQYAADAGYFADSGVDAGPVNLLQSGVAGGNGVYRYSTSSTFPTSTFQATNYWVDVVYSTSALDSVAPSVTAIQPTDGSSDVGIAVTLTAGFSETMDASSIDETTFQLRTAGGALVPAEVRYDSAASTAALDPFETLEPSTMHTATIRGGSGGARDIAGNPLAQDVTWSFTTESLSVECTAPANAIVAENCLTGNPESEWDVNGVGDPSIQGYATELSVDQGETVSFTIDTDAAAYTIDIYRLGDYGGLGARKVASILPSVSLPQLQPACLTDPTTGLIDCGNWAVSASWSVPADATSGVYIARPRRTDTGGASHIVFIVRDDNGTSDILFQTADTTWQAYNDYGGNSLYVGAPDGRAYKVSYNRPFATRSVDGGQDWLFNAEYPMIRWLEANGYDVSYFTGIDTDRRGALLLNHKVFMSVGHDEYWSGPQRANVENARNSGVHLAFFSGNEIFWKTRWEPSIDGTAQPYRTLVSYKETHADGNIDPQSPPTWTGTWRDPRFSPPADGGRPENALTGTWFRVNSGTTAIEVPASDGGLRFWRNTSVAALQSGAAATLAEGTLGYEWDEAPDNGFQPAGLMHLSTTVVPGIQVLLDHGSSYGGGTATHNLTLYRHASGALVFGAGTIQWSWGLDGNHDRGGSVPDDRMRQATVNLLADMGVQPGTLQTGLLPAQSSSDSTPPLSAIESPAAGSTASAGSPVTVTGTATDSGGRVGGVEVSVDGGFTWHPAVGRENWSYTWTPSGSGSAAILTRAVDDSGNLEVPGPGISITVD